MISRGETRISGQSTWAATAYPTAAKRRGRDHGDAECNDIVSGEQDDQREHGEEDLARQIHDLDPSVALETLEHAEERKRRQPEDGLGREDHEQQVQVVLQRDAVDARRGDSRQPRA